MFRYKTKLLYHQLRASKIVGKENINSLLRRTTLHNTMKQFLKVLSTNMFKFLKRIRRFFSKLTFEQKYYVLGMVLANLPDLDIAMFVGSFALSFFKGFSKMIDRFQRLWELFISLTNKKKGETTGSTMNTSEVTNRSNTSSTNTMGSAGNLSQYDSDTESNDVPPSSVPTRRWKSIDKKNKNSLTFRRTISHSLVINLLFSPLIGYGAKKILGLHGFTSFTHCTTLAVLCTSSHLLLDFLTNFGTALFYPFSKDLFSFGIITSWDFTMVFFFYSWLTASRLNRWRQSKVFWYGILCFLCLIIWKRAMMCEVYSRYFFFMESQKRKHSKSVQNAPTIWLQPSNFINGQYTVMKYDPKMGDLVCTCNLFNFKR